MKSHPQNTPEQDFPEVSRLIALKRYEQPEEGYFENFVDEFHRRQKLAERKKAKAPSFLAKWSQLFEQLRLRYLVYGAGAAYAAIMLALMFVETPQALEQPAMDLTPTEGVDLVDPAPVVEEDLSDGVIVPLQSSQLFDEGGSIEF